MDGFIVKPKEKCPAEKASFMSKFFFWWLKKIFVTAVSRDLEIEDLCYPLESDTADRVTSRLERAWSRELKKLKNLEYSPGPNGKKKSSGASPSLCRAICVVFWWDYMKCGLKMFTMNIVLKTVQPLFQGVVIGYFGGSGAEKLTPKNVALLYAAALIVTILISVWLHHHTYLECYQVGMRARVACGSLVYGKVLRLSKSALNKTTPGQIVNLLSNDLSRFDIVAPLLHKLWILPMQIIVIGSCLYMVAGPIAFVGMGSLLLLIVPVQFIVIRSIKSLRRLVANLSDQRIQLMGELINGIQVIKMYAWERTFAKVVSGARDSEMSAIRSANYLRAFTLAISMFTDKVNLFATLVTYVLMGNELTAEIVFTIALYYNILQSGSAFVFPMAVLQTSEVAVSVRRLQNFLMLEECIVNDSIEAGCSIDGLNDTQSSTLVPESPENLSTIEETLDEETPTAINGISPTRNPVFLEMQRLSANWLEGQLPPTLCDVSIKIHGGELCVLVGQVGSGKSSLLNVVLRELPIGAGNLLMRQRFAVEFEELAQKRGYVTDNPNLVVSYASQEAWLVTGTVRDNILFGQAWDPRKYQEVTKVCALWRDIRRWPDGDATIVGDRGIALSGGQKARVNLARAVYKDADIYLLDDPLSAVDNRVGQHLFRKCINGYLNGKTRILVTHQLQYLKSADTIVVLDRGLVRAQGTFDDLSKSDPHFTSLLNLLANSEKENEKKSSTETLAINEAAEIEQSNVAKWASVNSIDNLSIDWTDESGASLGTSSQNSEISPKGKMSWEVWKRYLCTGNSAFVLIILAAMILIAQISLSMTDLWLSYWSNLEAVRASVSDPSSGIQPEAYIKFANNTIFSYFSMLDEAGLLTTESAIYLYSFLIACCVVFNLTRNIMFMGICVRISCKLHNRMFRKILRAPMRFFNTNQSGRIVNRFSKDVGAMDELLPSALLDSSRVMLLMGGVFVTIVITNPWMAIPMAILLPAFWWVSRYYLVTAYSIKRLEGLCKSPIFTQVIATIQGLATIRSNGPAIAKILKRQFNEYQDIHSGVWYLSNAATSAFSLWLDLFTCAFVACVCFTPILLDHGDTFGGTVGLAISQSMLLTGLLQYGVKQCAETAIYMTAIERMLQYTDIKSEESPTSANPPPADWPTQGRLTLKNVFMSYTDDNLPVLKNLNLTFEPGWKVGVVGRTGAGKSSLISAIFRLENEGLQGEIKIDGRDTSSLALDELRSRISIIPQESVLFSGTLRYNLDPFNCYDDAVLWDALKEVELGDLSLELAVSEGGSNFSVGQRQLICLARAILKNNRILVLDEATANIDAKTDALIQKTLKTKFARHTVITVAHRLVTVIENDRILVMEDGQALEFGCPYELLCNNPDGPFAEMVRQAGPAVAENLIRLAEVACLEVPAQHSLDLNSTVSDNSVASTLHKE